MARRGLWLAAPLAAFLVVFFVVPIGWLLSLAVREAEVPRALPRTLSRCRLERHAAAARAAVAGLRVRTWSMHAPPARWPMRRGD
jgi:ABC-type sugar transport system permease subunit